MDIAEVFKVQKTFLKTETIFQTAVTTSKELSDMFGCNVFLKREDQQRGIRNLIVGKTYKIRGAYSFFLKEEKNIREKGLVLVSDGNFATSMSILTGAFKCKNPYLF